MTAQQQTAPTRPTMPHTLSAPSTSKPTSAPQIQPQPALPTYPAKPSFDSYPSPASTTTSHQYLHSFAGQQQPQQHNIRSQNPQHQNPNPHSQHPHPYPPPHQHPQHPQSQYQNTLHPSILSRLHPQFLHLYTSHLSHRPPPPTDLAVVRANYSSLYRFASRPPVGVGGIGETGVPGWRKYASSTGGNGSGGEIGVRVYVPPGDCPPDSLRDRDRSGNEKGLGEDENGRSGGEDVNGGADAEPGVEGGEAGGPTAGTGAAEGRTGRAEGTRGIWPVHFNFHGGGWAVGDLETSAHFCHHICAAVPCCVIDIEYRLIPEYPFPIGIMDSLSAVVHILANHKTFSIDPTRFTLGGESSGATIALILNHILRDAGTGDDLKGVVAGTPTISDVRKYATPDMSPWPSMRESMYTPLLNWEKLKWFDTFKWMSLSTQHPGVSAKEMKKDVAWFADAMNAPDFKNLAPVTWVGVAGVDPLRDEALAYAEKVREAGNKVVVEEYQGMPHMFVHMDGVLEEGRRFVDDVVKVLRGCLYGIGGEGTKVEGKGESNEEVDEEKGMEKIEEMERGDEVMIDVPSK